MLLRQAMMMDPLVGAVCNPKEIWQMADEMLVAQEQWPTIYGFDCCCKGPYECRQSEGTSCCSALS